MDVPPASDDDLRGRGLRAVTGSRLHFGLLDTVEPFGGVGVMVQEPATEIVLTPAEKFCCGQDGEDEDNVSDRVRDIAQRVARRAGRDELPACRLVIESRPQSHTGMGSGTQLSMAIAETLCLFTGVAVSTAELACQIAGRAQRSAVGVHGYFQGGMIVEASDVPCDLNPLQARVEPPSAWTVALFWPRVACTTVSGKHERRQFSQLRSAAPDARAELSRIVTERMLPAAKSGDFATFAESVHQYNHQSGLLFESVQGGAYNGRAVAELIDTLTQRGACGVGQSSWGPGVFSWFQSKAEAIEFVAQLPSDLADHSITSVRNRPRIIEATRGGEY